MQRQRIPIDQTKTQYCPLEACKICTLAILLSSTVILTEWCIQETRPIIVNGTLNTTKHTIAEQHGSNYKQTRFTVHSDWI